MSDILISDKIINLFCQHAEEEYPHECCGFLIGQFGFKGASAEEYHPVLNVKTSNRERRFLIDPMDYQNVEDEAESRNLSIVGIVHSHPDHPDSPSEFDRRHAFPGFSYVIVSAQGGKVAGYRSWRLKADRSGFDTESICKRDREVLGLGEMEDAVSNI